MPLTCSDEVLDDFEASAVIRPKRGRRKSSQSDSVILSSKYVFEKIRERLESPDPEDLWGEYPKASAEILEKRGIEVDAKTGERYPRKKIRLAEAWPGFTFKTPVKRDSKGRSISRLSSPRSDSRQRYFLTSKNMEWLEVYNCFAAEKKVAQITPEAVERMIELLEEKKNCYIIENMRLMISALNNAGEGNPRLHRMEYDALQKFVDLTPETFSKVAYKELGQLCGLSPEASFDVWEFWKCQLQDNFYQPLVPPKASEFDYRRLSLLVAWNMTNTSYAQRIRHDAERVRLMFDILQKRNLASGKVSLQEEELTAALVELSMSTEMKHVPAEKAQSILGFMKEFSSLNGQREQVAESSLEEFIMNNGPPRSDQFGRILPQTAPRSPGPAKLRSTKVESPLVESTVPRSVSLDVEIGEVPLELVTDQIVEEPKKRSRRGIESRQRSPLSLRMTRARIEVSRPAKFEHHSDSSCCENGPVDEEEMMRERKGSIRLVSLPVLSEVLRDDPSEEPLYLLNDISQKFNLPSKSPDLRSRLRTRKNI